MESMSLDDVMAEELAAARESPSGRAARTVHGGRRSVLRQTVLAVLAGRELTEHSNPGEVTLQVLRGRIRVTAGEQTWEGGMGDYVIIPAERHALTAVEDSVILLSVVATPSQTPGGTPE